MKNQNRILFFLTVLLGITSCGDDDAGKASKEEVRAAFEVANDQLSADLNSFNTSSGYQAMNQLSTLTNESNPFGRKSSRKREQVIENLKAGVYAIRGILKNSTTAANARVNSDEPFDYNANKGIYEWDPQEGAFVPTGESEIIEIRFPTEGSATNNAEFRLTSYAEELTPHGDQRYSPTHVEASIFVNETKELELNADIDYGDEDAPAKGDVYYFVNPFALEISLDDTKTTASTFSESLSKSGKVLIGFGATVNFYDASKLEDAIKSASAHIQLVDLKFVIVAKTPQSSSSGDINDFVTIPIQVNHKAGGRIILELNETTGEVIPYVKYTDGSTELLETLLQDLSSEIEDMLQ